MTKEDPKFQYWLSIVSPDDETEADVLAAVDWTQILTILLDIFQVLLGMGCLAKARLTGRVRNVLKTKDRNLILTNLQQIRSDLAAKKGKK